jgi:hypothetical protein
MEVKEDVTCNLCGLSYAPGMPGHPAYNMYGLIKVRVSDGYESTFGNGREALDDCTSYSFSLREFCLDWFFGQLKMPVAQRILSSGTTNRKLGSRSMSESPRATVQDEKEFLR